jgi:hypothetical protein
MEPLRERHKGTCLGFDIAHDIGLRGVETVVYEAKKLKLDDELNDANSLPTKLQARLLITKFEHWRYEQEVRFFVDLSNARKEGGMYFWPFDDRLRLREVILGPECPREQLGPIRALVRATNPGAVVSRARLGFKFFEVKPDSRFPPK